jgi:hypothetical protein
VAHLALAIFKTDPLLPFVAVLSRLSGIGMTLFFVLSGFVIHYNYRDVASPRGQGALRRFIRARVSRLYPLYLALIAFDVVVAWMHYPANLRVAPQALAYYLPMAQAWRYLVLGGSSLIYQFGYLSSVSWSVSVEVFFYIVYVFIAGGLQRLTRLASHLAVGAGAYLATLSLLYFVQTHLRGLDRWAVGSFGSVAGLAGGVQDSFVRWLVYFSPYARLMEFLVGCLAANWFLQTTGVTGDAARRAGAAMSLIVVGAIVWLNTMLYGSGVLVLGLTGSVTYAPLVALLLVLVARFKSPVSRLLESDWLRKGGDASYSIYLLHLTIILEYSHSAIPSGPIPYVLLSVKMALTPVVIVTAARLVFVAFERPAREWLRGHQRLGDWPGSAAGALWARPRLVACLVASHVALVITDRLLLARL